MPKVLRRQRAGNKCECLYPSVWWGGRGDFMFHSLPQAFVREPGIMEKSVSILLQWMIKLCFWTYLQAQGDSRHRSIGWLIGNGRSIFLPTSEYSILWTCILYSTTRQWILFGESRAVVDVWKPQF